MIKIAKKILMDDNQHPIAVQIDYNDWKKVEQLLGIEKTSDNIPELKEYQGVIHISEDPVQYQKQIRGEWS